jgi:RND family efflux transporter MFP subunit
MRSHRKLESLLALAGVCACAAGAANAQGPTPVSFTEVADHAVRRSVDLPGTVESRIASVVAAEVGGLVVRLDVREGERVRAGEPLAGLRTIGFELRLQAAEGRLKESRARLDLAERKLARARELFDDDVISQDELDDAFSEFTAWQGRIDQDTAEIDQLELALDRCEIEAPFTGVVTAKRTELGEWVETGGAVVEMVSLAELEVRVEVPERYFPQLVPDATAEVRFESLPGHTVTGRVAGIVPRADGASRAFPIRVVIDNPQRLIGVGMLARVALPVGESYRALLVPKDAVVRQGPSELVYRINGDDAVEAVPVASTQGVGSWVVVDGPVAAGDRVVTRGNERLRPGQSVRGELLEYPLP